MLLELPGFELGPRGKKTNRMKHVSNLSTTKEGERGNSRTGQLQRHTPENQLIGRKSPARGRLSSKKKKSGEGDNKMQRLDRKGSRAARNLPRGSLGWGLSLGGKPPSQLRGRLGSGLRRISGWEKEIKAKMTKLTQCGAG